jgi:sulfonate transport system substrate-binding protein
MHIILTSSTSKFRTVSDLRGKTFSITKPGGGSHINTMLLAKMNGWKQDLNYKTNYLGTFLALVDAAKSNTIDAFVWKPFSINALLEKDLRVVADVVPPWPCFMIAARTGFLDDRASEIRKVLSAFYDAAATFHCKREGSIRLVAEKYNNLALADAEKWFNSVRYSLDGTVARSEIEKVVEALIAAGVVKNKIGVETICANEFASIV